MFPREETRRDFDLSADGAPTPEYDGPTCYYCGEPMPFPAVELDIYCSALCACYAERDNNER